MNTFIVTHHSVEFVRKGRSKPEHGVFRLEVPIELREASKKQLVPAFIRRLPETEDVILHGSEGRLWRPVGPSTEEHQRDPMYHAEASITNSGGLLVGWAVHRPLGFAANRFNRAISPETLPSFAEARNAKGGIGPDARIVSEDTPARIRAAGDAARKVIKIGHELWIQVRDPMLFVRKLGNRYDTKLLVDIHSDFSWWRLDGMLFRADRAAAAAMWPSVAAGKSVPALGASKVTPEQALIPHGVTRFDPTYFSDDDLVQFAKDHLTRVVDACAPVIEAMSPRLRQAWQQLRTYRELLDEPGAREAAEAGLLSVPETLEMLMEVRDVPVDDRMRLVRSISRLEVDQRRVTEIEGIAPPRCAENAQDELEELDLGGLAP